MVKIPLVFSLRKELIMNYIESFESHLREQGKADKTIQSYIGDTAQFLTYLESKELSFDGILNRFTINSYKNHLIKENYEPTTINKKLNSLQSFNDFLIHENIMKEKVVELGRDRIKIAKGSEKPVEVYSDDLIESLLFHMRRPSCWQYQYRWTRWPLNLKTYIWICWVL